MTEFTSEIKTVPYPETKVYEVLSDLSNLEKMRDKIPQEKIKDFSFDTDSCSFSVNPVGKVRFNIVEREPSKTIKFAVDQAPIDVNMWIQLKETEPGVTKMKLTVKAGLNPFLKPMLSKPLQDGINKIADVLANVPYNEIKD
ncbi:SRPBCC family protein [Bacteroidales bacterium OttesenSCG-928-A17]|nr:SRPBCC family protein [Bacteroidales bacterium OttesenSCG-928-A17]